MAKDKSKKSKAEETKPEKVKAKKVKAKKGGGDFARPSEAPATGGDGWKFEHEDNLGELFLITPLRTEKVAGFEDKEAEVVVADIVHLNRKKPEKSEAHEEAYIFGGWTKGSTRGFIGESLVLGVLGKDKSKGKGSNAAWVLEDASEKEVDVARAYRESADPFKQTSTDKKKSKKK